MPLFFRNLVNAADTNCGLLSDTSDVGNPILVNIKVKCWMMIAVVVFLKGTASGQRVAMSKQVRRYLNPPLATGNGPTISMAILSDGTLTLASSFFSMQTCQPSGTSHMT